jgi:two-component system sensor histidine kinase KdpD
MRRRELIWTAVWIATLAALCAALLPARSQLDAGTTALVLLMAPVVATLGSLRLALVASAVSAIVMNVLFIKPYGTLSIASSTGITALCVYLVVAVVLSVTAERLRRYIATSDQRAAHAALLRDMTIDLVRQRVWLQPPVSSALADLVRALDLRGATMHVSITGGESFTVQDGDHEQCDDALASLEHDLGPTSDAANVGVVALRRPHRVQAFPVATASDSYGMLAVQHGPDSDHDPGAERAIGLFTNVVALACERAAFVQSTVETRALEETDRMRTRMMRAVTHDLRTPLTSIRALASAIADVGPVNRQQRSLVDDIETEADRLTQLINHVLDLSQIDSGGLQLHLQDVTVDELVRSAAAALRPSAAVEVDVPERLPTIPVDETLLRQALVNLLDNAVRHGKPPIQLRVHERDGRLEIRVVDHGKGIPASERRRIFDPNYAMRHATQDERRHGLGLAVSAGFVEAQRGQLRVEPTPGGGATFVVSLPIDDRATP